jgi:hypothetical protein
MRLYRNAFRGGRWVIELRGRIHPVDEAAIKAADISFRLFFAVMFVWLVARRLLS